MPFVYLQTDSNNNKIFDCKLKCERCRAMTKASDGTKRCTLTPCIGIEMCPSHAKLHMHLQVKTSTIAGKGLFAYDTQSGTRPVFKRGQKVVDLVGEMITEGELEKRYPGNVLGPYAISDTAPNGRTVYMDTACRRGLGAIANAPLVEGKANAKFFYRNKTFSLFATKKIMHGDEILADYGTTYDFNTNHSTTYSRAKN